MSPHHSGEFTNFQPLALILTITGGAPSFAAHFSVLHTRLIAAANGGYTRLQPLTHESSTTAGTKLRSCRIQLRRGAALARIGSGRRRAGKDRRLMIPTLCVRNQIRHSTLISGTQRMGHPQCGGGKKQLRNLEHAARRGPAAQGGIFQIDFSARLRSPRLATLISPKR